MKRILLVPVLLFVFTTISLAQKKAEEALDKLYKNFPQEKVILTLSKNDYLAGETVHFKVHTLVGYEPSDISTNAYIELYDRNRIIIDSVIVPLYRGAGEGSFQVPAGTAEGVYFVRAYTHWMLNFKPLIPYMKSVRIYNPYSSYRLAAKPVKLMASVFPESGTLVADIPSKMVIRLSGGETLPSHWNAHLYEVGKADPVTTTSSINPQLAVVQFTPKSGTNYRIEIIDNGGNRQEVQLPAVQNAGTVLQVRSEGDRIGYTIHFRNPKKGEGYKMIGTIHDETVIHAQVKRSTGRVEGSFETKNIPNGVLRLTVFDENEMPVAERLCFVKPLQMTTHRPVITFDTLAYGVKAPNSWMLQQDTTQWFTWSVQVQDAAYPKPDNFLANLYLTSDFISAIYDPSWYFENTDSNKVAALDALLITEQWQRFDWKDLVNGKLPKITITPEKFLSYKATVVRKRKVERLKDVNLVFQQAGYMQVVQAPIDSFGHFYLERLAFSDTMKVLYQLNNKKYSAKDIDIVFEPLHRFYPMKSPLPEVPYSLLTRKANDTLPAHINRSLETMKGVRLLNEKSKMLQEVVIRYKKKSPAQELDDKLSSGLFKSDNETLFDFINEDQASAMSYNNILQWLEGRVPGLRVVVDEEGRVTPMMRGGVPEVFVDEMIVEPEFLGGLSVSDIAMVKVIRGVFLGARAGGGGAIAVYTRRAGIRSTFNIPSLPSDILVGYRKMQQLPAPDYSVEGFKSIADVREILFRRDLLIPDVQGRSRIFFYNNDRTQRFRLIITGFTGDGTPVFLDQAVEQDR